MSKATNLFSTAFSFTKNWASIRWCMISTSMVNYRNCIRRSWPSWKGNEDNRRATICFFRTYSTSNFWRGKIGRQSRRCGVTPMPVCQVRRRKGPGGMALETRMRVQWLYWTKNWRKMPKTKLNCVRSLMIISTMQCCARWMKKPRTWPISSSRRSRTTSGTRVYSWLIASK